MPMLTNRPYLGVTFQGTYRLISPSSDTLKRFACQEKGVWLFCMKCLLASSLSEIPTALVVQAIQHPLVAGFVIPSHLEG